MIEIVLTCMFIVLCAFMIFGMYMTAKGYSHALHPPLPPKEMRDCWVCPTCGRYKSLNIPFGATDRCDKCGHYRDRKEQLESVPAEILGLQRFYYYPDPLWAEKEYERIRRNRPPLPPDPPDLADLFLQNEPVDPD